MRHFVPTCAGAFAVALAASAQQQEQVAAPSTPVVEAGATRHRHLGAFFRPDAGVGYVSMRASQNGMDASIAGAAATFGFAAGGALSENSILAFHVWEAVMQDPSISMGGQAATGGSTVTLLAFGPEYTLYTRQNLYLSFSPSLTRIRLQTNGMTGDTNWGLGMRAALGKEWWAGEHWGLGVVGQLSVSVNQDGGQDAPTWTSWAGTVSFSATYN